MPRYELADIAVASPDGTSGLPDYVPLGPGDTVKVVVLASGSGEGLWVFVTSVQGEGDDRRITGKVANHPVFTGEHGLTLYARIELQPKHVRDVQFADAPVRTVH